MATTPEVDRLIEIVNDHAKQINNLQAITSAQFVVTRLLAERYLKIADLEETLGKLDDAFAYTRLTDETIALAQKYLRSLLEPS